VSTLLQNWHLALNSQETLLAELLSVVKDERVALMANDVDRLRETTLLKDKVSRKLALLRDEIKALKISSLTSLNLSSDAEIDCVFESFGRDECRALQKKRGQLNTLNKTLRRQNEFNSDCLKVYLGHVGGVRSILSLVYDRNTTYNPRGLTSGDEKRSLLNRSI
jgi:flagellar biosynthesis/type III secretory pathway chaperone